MYNYVDLFEPYILRP